MAKLAIIAAAISTLLPLRAQEAKPAQAAATPAVEEAKQGISFEKANIANYLAKLTPEERAKLPKALDAEQERILKELAKSLNEKDKADLASLTTEEKVVLANALDELAAQLIRAMLEAAANAKLQPSEQSKPQVKEKTFNPLLEILKLPAHLSAAIPQALSESLSAKPAPKVEEDSKQPERIQPKPPVAPKSISPDGLKPVDQIPLPLTR